jgi:hypothetical protein
MLQGDRESYITISLQLKIHQIYLGLLMKEAAMVIAMVIYGALEEDKQHLQYV